MLEFLTNVMKLTLILIFLISSITKLSNLKNFVNGVIEYNVVPRNLSRFYGYSLPFIELVSSVMIFFHKSSYYGLALTLLMLVSFFIAVSKVIKSKRVITCSCFGNFLDSKVDLFSIYRIGALIVLNVLAIILSILYSSNFSATSLIFSVVIVLIYLLSQIIWNEYRKNIKLLET
ncbi:MauE/DoxX family redox-associated membrane protein [Paenibacillus sp. 2KB_20]